MTLVGQREKVLHTLDGRRYLVDDLSRTADAGQVSRRGEPSVKRPRKVVFTDAYPTTATGKVRRVELREMAAAALVASGRPAEAVPGASRP